MEDDIAGDAPPGSPIAGDMARGALCHRPLPRCFPVLLIASLAGAWSKGFPAEGVAEDYQHLEEQLSDGTQRWLALLHVSASLQSVDEPIDEVNGAYLASAAIRDLRCCAQGLVVYKVLETIGIEPIQVPADVDPIDLWRDNRDRLKCGQETLRAVVRRWCGAMCPTPWLACPQLAARVWVEGLEIIHAVAFSGKLDRGKLIGNWPSPSTMMRFRSFLRRDGPPRAPADPREQHRVGTNPWSGMSAQQILDWVDATSTIKSMNQKGQAALAWSKLLLKLDKKPQKLEEVIPAEDILSRNRLRMARVRVDCVAMLVFRLAHIMWQSPSYYLWSDSSPQWRGREFCASSFDTYENGTLERWLLPCLALVRGQTTAVFKTLALLWQILLMVGAENVQAFCRSVRALTTDMGTERKLARAPIAILQNFFRHLGSNIFVATDSPWLFPNALQVPGWKHGIDLLLRRGLWLMPFIPKFMKQVKALVAFLREDAELLCDHFRSRGLEGLAALLESMTLPTFAAWRWATLDEVCKCVERFATSLSLFFDAHAFRNTKATVRLRIVAEALASKGWHAQLTFVAWFCRVMTELLSWGGGCNCHGPQHSKAERDSCKNKGRRIGQAYLHAMNWLRCALEEISAWTPGMLGGDLDLLRQGQACMRATWLMAQDKLRVFDEVPCLLTRLDEPGVRDRCLAQWDAGARDAGDPVAAEFLEDTPASLRADLVAMTAEGTGMSPRLRAAWDSLRRAPIDDTVGEGPHAQMKHVQGRARAATWAWQCASTRLTQNLRDIETLLPTVQPHTDLQWCWDRWGCVLQVDKGRKSNRNKRITRTKAEEMVYSMKHFKNFELHDMPTGHEMDEAEDADEGDDDDGRPPDGDVDDESVGDGWGRMLREYYEAALRGKTGGFYSFANDDGGHECFQLLSFRPVLSLVKSFRPAPRFVCKVSVLPLQTWAQRGETPNLVVDVFETDDPVNMDMATFVKEAGHRSKFYAWREQESDVDGCISLCNPQLVQPLVKLGDPKVPVLSLLDALASAGIEIVERLVTHKPGGDPCVVDGRKMATRRFYFQCVLARQTLWDRGVVEFRSNKSQAWYRLLLNDKLAGLTRENLRSRLADCGVLPKDIEVLAGTAELPRPDPEGDCIAGDDGLAVAAHEEESSSDSPSSSTTTSEVDDNDVAGDEDVAAYVPPAYIGDVKVGVEEHVSRGEVSRGLRVRCPVCKTRKFASLAKDPYEIGHRCAEAFLGAWLGLCAGDALSHGNAMPTKAQQLACLDS